MVKFFKSKKVKYSLITASVIISAAVFVIISKNTVFAGKKPALSSKNLEITEGSYKTLKLNGAGSKVKWSIKKGKDIIEIKDKKESSVKIYGSKEGVAKVKAKFKGKAYTCNVRVTAGTWQEMPENTPVPDKENGENDMKERSKEWNAIAGFGSEVLKDLWQEDENIMVSPVSIFNALAMTANGAKGSTLSQMEDVFGISVNECNNYLGQYNNTLPSGDKYKLDIANSIWVNEINSFKTEPGFIKKNQDIFGAEVFTSQFSSKTSGEINNWVDRNTDGMIKDVIDNVPQDAMMYLINALAFDAEWKNIYDENSIRDGKFTKEDGTKQDVPLMYSTEGTYIEDENTTGFVKYYADSKYAFIALLPDKGTTIEEYVNSLDSEKLDKLINSMEKIHVNAAIPKFKSEYSASLKEVLQGMGMADAFDSAKADFSGIGKSTDGNLCIDDVIHKTFIEVDEKGTKAGAATVVIAVAASAMMPYEEKTVYLDRPFVYIIADCKSWLPAFYGVVQGIK
ncbi:MAG: serine protease inhibitor [Lachnospiraceae bacterium]|nr:serine protease inhibitor [Lachnospiraceae bacterium]